MVALYIRLSRLDDDLDEYKQISNSVENQRKLLTEYLDEVPNLRNEETEEFIDDGWSGTNFQRPAFQRMLAYYSQDLSKKIKSTFNMKREHGEIFFNAPFGYIKDEKHSSKVVIDEEAAEIVRHIFTLACEGRTTTSIAKKLNSENIPTVTAYNRKHSIKGKNNSIEKSAYAAWTSCKVSNILNNEFYMGTYIGQKRKRVVTGMKKTVQIADPVKIPNNHPAIVDKDTFEKAQSIFVKTKRRPSEEKRYQLKSKVVCGNCGYNMAYNDNIYEDCYFYCNHTGRTGKHDGCPNDRVPEEMLNARVFTQLKQWMMLLEAACGSVDEAEQKRWEGLRLLGDEAEGLQAEFKSLQSRKLELYESYSDGHISKDEFIGKKEKLAAEMSSIRDELNKIHEREAQLRKTRNRRKPELDELMENVKLFENEKRLTCKMADTFVEKVTVYDKWCIEIAWKCEDLVEVTLNEVALVEAV